MSATAARLCVVSAQSASGNRLQEQPTNVPSNIGESDASAIDLMRRSPVFRDCSFDQAQHIHRFAQERTFEARAVLSREGDIARGITLILSGCVKVVRCTAEGGEIILRFAGRGETTGAVAVQAGRGEPYTVQAMEPCRTLYWDCASFDALSGKYPLLHRNLALVVSEQLMAVEDRLCELATAKVSNRVARAISRLCFEVGDAMEGGILLRLSREDIAQIAGTTMFAVSRLLSAWERIGIVKTMRQAIVVVDRAALTEVAEAA